MNRLLTFHREKRRLVWLCSEQCRGSSNGSSGERDSRWCNIRYTVRFALALTSIHYINVRRRVNHLSEEQEKWKKETCFVQCENIIIFSIYTNSKHWLAHTRWKRRSAMLYLCWRNNLNTTQHIAARCYSIQSFLFSVGNDIHRFLLPENVIP